MPKTAVRNTAHLKRVFLDDFAVWGNISRGCRITGVSRNTIYDWLEKDEQFAMLYEQAKISAVESLEEEARRRAVEGVEREKPVIYKGEIIGTTTEIHYSDTLLIFTLKGLAPHKYRDNAPPPTPGNKVSLSQLRELVGIATDDQDDAASADE
jgi:hypothetical protein